jgi:hypothetical protein
VAKCKITMASIRAMRPGDEAVDSVLGGFTARCQNENGKGLSLGASQKSVHANRYG